MSHCAVPIFLMLTGKFVIDKASQISPKQFYLKALKKLGIPFIFFAVIYYIYDLYNGRIFSNTILETIYKGFVGYYAHWYVVMLSVIYAFIPIISFIKQRVDYKKYEKTVIIIFIWLMIGHYFEQSQTSWSLANLYFMGYVLIGDVISKRLEDKNNNFKGIVLIVIALIILTFNHIILYKSVLNGGDYYNKLLNLYGAPLIIVASLMIFMGFSLIKINKKIHILANTSYTIFLCHKFILDVLTEHTGLFQIIEQNFNWNLKIIILIEWILLFTISFIVAFIFNGILKKTIYRKIR